MRRRTLNRPRIAWLPSIALIVLAETSAELLASYWAGSSACSLWVCHAVAQAAVTLIAGRWVLVFLIKVYQRYAPEEVRLRCHCQPSCSDYAIAVLKRYGLAIGGMKALRRIFHTCDGQDITDLPYRDYSLRQTFNDKDNGTI